MHEFSHTRNARLSTRSSRFYFLVTSRKGGGLSVQFFEDGLRVRPLHLRTTAASWVSRRFLGWFLSLQSRNRSVNSGSGSDIPCSWSCGVSPALECHASR